MTLYRFLLFWNIERYCCSGLLAVPAKSEDWARVWIGCDERKMSEQDFLSGRETCGEDVRTGFFIRAWNLRGGFQSRISDRGVKFERETAAGFLIRVWSLRGRCGSRISNRGLCDTSWWGGGVQFGFHLSVHKYCFASIFDQYHGRVSKAKV